MLKPNSDWDDLTITPYLDSDSLPELLKDCLSCGKTIQEKDIALMSTLTAASAVLPNYFFRFGHSSKPYGTNLQTFIMAGAASGKGVASIGLDLVRKIDENNPLLIPGDSTYPAFYRQLFAQDGVGYIHESEGSVITDIWKSGAMSYNTALRKAAEHEPISMNRVLMGRTVIDNPRLSCLLTGTFGQFYKLVPSVENGFFSRLTILVVRGRTPFDKTVFSSKTPCPSWMEKCPEWSFRRDEGAEGGIGVCGVSQRMYRIYNALSRRQTPLEFRLTDEQADILGTWFEKEYGALTERLGENFHPTLVRMGITTMRIAAILTALRGIDSLDHPGFLLGNPSPSLDHPGFLLGNPSPSLEFPSCSKGATSLTSQAQRPSSPTDIVYCPEEIFKTALLLAGKLLLHAADAYNQIEGRSQQSVPTTRGSYQKIMLFESLPNEFTRKEGVEIGEKHGVSVPTIDRWLREWSQDGSIEQPKYGIYSKKNA